MEEYDVESILDMYEDDYVPESRPMMAGGGQLVQPSVDGSRPGYGKSKMGESKLGEGMENIYKEKIGPGKFRYFIKVGGKKYGQAIGEENLPTLKKKRDQVIKQLYPNRITNEDFSKLKNLKKYENMSSVEFSKVLNDKGFTTISGKKWNPKSTLRKIDELDLELLGRARSEDEIFEILKNIEGGPSKIKLYKEGIIPLEKLRDIATDYEKRQSPEFKETKKKIDTKANLKRAQELGNFPPGANPNDNLWAQVYRSAKDGDGRWRIVSKLPPLKDGKRDWIKNGDWKKMRVIDTQTGTEFGYKDLKSYLDNLEGSGTYDNALKPWQNKKDLNAVKIEYRGNTVSLGKVLSNKKIEKEFFEKTGKFPKGVEVEEINNFFKKKYPYGKSNFAVNHPEGVKNNWWNAEVVHKDANDRLERLDKSFRASLNSAQNKTQRNRIIELYKKDVKNIGNVTSVFEGQTIGKSNILDATKDAFKKEGLSRTYTANQKQIQNAILEFAGTITKKCKIGNAEGGRIGFQSGRNYCLNVGKQALEKGLKTGFPKNQQVLAEGILKAGRSLKDIASLRGLFGPLALGFTVLGEAGFIGYDMLSEGKSFKEAVGGNLINYMLGDKTKVDLDKEIIKRLRSIPGAPSQGFREFTEEDIGKMQAFKSALMEISNLNEQFGKLDTIQKNREALEMSPEDSAFNKGAFQLDKEEDLVRQNIQDFYRSGGQQRLESVDYGEGAKQLLRGNLLAEQDQLYDAGIGKFYQAPKGDEKRIKRLNEIRYQLDKLQNPPQYDEFGEYFMSRPPSEQSYLMGLGYSEGGIATLKNKKKTNTQKIASVYNNPGFKYWAVPPKKGPASKGLKVPPKQVKKV